MRAIVYSSLNVGRKSEAVFWANTAENSGNSEAATLLLEGGNAAGNSGKSQAVTFLGGRVEGTPPKCFELEVSDYILRKQFFKPRFSGYIQVFSRLKFSD